MKNFIQISDFTTDEIFHVLDRADELKKCWDDNKMPQSLSRQRIALWFYGNGFRNRIAFEIGARAMGANISFVPGELGIQEPLEDIGHYLNNWFTMLIIRCKAHSDLLSVTNQVNVPVINARTNYNHPCEIIGDLQYIRRKRHTLDGLNVVFVGEVTNLCMSWFEAAKRLPITVTQVSPKGYEIDNTLLGEYNHKACGQIKVSNDLESIVSQKTDVIYTDCWPKSEEPSRIRNEFIRYQINSEILSKMNTNGFFLPCPPVTRGQEVSNDAMQSKLCVDYAAKEYLLHSQNAIMEYVTR